MSPVHGLPSATASEPFGRSGGDSVQDRDELGSHTGGTDLAKEDTSGHGLVGIVVHMALEEDNGVRIVCGRPSTDLRRGSRA
jgi:hypothetical protein